jgi:hypothetical protein
VNQRIRVKRGLPRYVSRQKRYRQRRALRMLSGMIRGAFLTLRPFSLMEPHFAQLKPSGKTMQWGGTVEYFDRTAA